MKTKVEVITGPEGQCLSINDIRVAGPKPWGGGVVSMTWNIDDKYIKEALNITMHQDCFFTGGCGCDNIQLGIKPL